MTVAVYNSIDRIIRMAMFDAGLIEEGADPNADQQGNYAQRLLDMMLIWQVEGCKLFLIQDLVLPLVVNQSAYTIGPSGNLNMVRPVRIEDVYWVDAQGTSKRDIFRVEQADWVRMPPPQTNGTVTQFYEDRQINTIVLNLWNKPSAQDVAGALHVVARTAGPGSVTSVAQLITAHFPIEWAMALRWGLAADICTGQPDSIVARCEKMAGYYKGILENFDVEQGGISFEPDLQGQQPSRFR
jgi:hypothetical protein